jgi:ABC-2 type transport system ATP-binding protein
LVEDLCESVTIIDHGRVVVAGDVDALTTHGTGRLVVRVEGDRTGRWAKKLRGATVSEVDRGAVRLAVEEGADSDAILDAARAAGRVTEFHFERRRLSEVFREALG